MSGATGPTTQRAAAVAVTAPSRYDDDWRARLDRLAPEAPCTALGLHPGDSLVVLGAHPDDETFGVGATLAQLGSDGVDVHLVCMSAGEAALDQVDVRVTGLADRRREEFVQAARSLGVASASVLGFPDGRLRDFEDDLTAAAESAVRQWDARHIMTVWWDDPHPDHQAVGRSGVRAAEITCSGVSGYPIWAQHWSDPADTLTRATTVTLMSTTAPARSARDAAIACYTSQTEPLSEELQPVLPDAVARWTHELVIR